MEGTRGFEPPTCSFVASRANSVAPRPRLDFGFWILDLFENLRFTSGFACLIFKRNHESVNYNPKPKIQNPKSKWQAHSDLNEEFRFWRPTFCRLKLRACKTWSERRESNPQHPVWKTGTQPFEFRSLEKRNLHREGFEPSQRRKRDSFTDCQPLPTGDRCTKNRTVRHSWRFLCKNIKISKREK